MKQNKILGAYEETSIFLYLKVWIFIHQILQEQDFPCFLVLPRYTWGPLSPIHVEIMSLSPVPC